MHHAPHPATVGTLGEVTRTGHINSPEIGLIGASLQMSAGKVKTNVLTYQERLDNGSLSEIASDDAQVRLIRPWRQALYPEIDSGNNATASELVGNQM
jgi:hypothetical protein